MLLTEYISGVLKTINDYSKTGLIIRYDNSKHKPELTFYNHKHLRDGTISEFFQPDVQSVLDEIMEYLL